MEIDLIELIDQWGELAPGREAHISGQTRLTYHNLVQRSNSLGIYLRDHLPDDHSPVVVLGHKEPEMLIGFLGAVKAGHPYIPLDTSIPQGRVAHIQEIAGASFLLTPERVDAILKEIGTNPGLTSFSKVRAADPWYIIFTSGSTGEPKGVVITAGCLTSFLAWILGKSFPSEIVDTFLNQAPFSFDLSVMDLYQSLVTGSTLFSLTKDEIANPKELYQSLAHSKTSVWVSTPSFAQMCLVEPTFSASILPHLRRFLFCGETLPSEVATQLLERFPQAEVWNTYGPTETTVATTSVQIDQHILERYSPLPVGFPKPDSRIIVQRVDGSQAEQGERGEIVIAGPNVSPGYISRPDLTSRAFFLLDDVWAYRTGDWGHFQDGMLFFDGRIDQQIKLHGYRIELGDVEANLRAVSGIRDAVVLPVMKNGLPDSLTAFVILSDQPSGSNFETTRLFKQLLSQRLPAYMIPRKFCYLETFPMTANGKVDRRKLSDELA
jgi:D-alanine--poly(phosphoribitol) ligase subunit 1